MNPPRVTRRGLRPVPARHARGEYLHRGRPGQPGGPAPPARGAFTRLLHRLGPQPAELWAEVAPLVDRATGVLGVDDTTVDKPHARKVGRVTRHWPGKHRAVVDGVNRITVVWADADRLSPTDYRVSHKSADGRAEDDHFRGPLAAAHDRGSAPGTRHSTGGTPGRRTRGWSGRSAGCSSAG